MSKLIVNQIIAKATLDINRKKNESKMPEKFRKIQDAFRTNPALQNQEAYAELVGLLTGFRPRTSRSKIVPFEVFALINKSDKAQVKLALCVATAGEQSYGCSSTAEAHLVFDCATCRLATPEEALKFISEEVSTWDDTSFMNWINLKLGGGQYFHQFFAELERIVPEEKAS